MFLSLVLNNCEEGNPKGNLQDDDTAEEHFVEQKPPSFDELKNFVEAQPKSTLNEYGVLGMIYGGDSDFLTLRAFLRSQGIKARYDNRVGIWIVEVQLKDFMDTLNLLEKKAFPIEFKPTIDWLYEEFSKNQVEALEQL